MNVEEYAKKRKSAKTVTIRILPDTKRQLDSILLHGESYADAIDILIVHWQIPKKKLISRRARSVIPTPSSEQIAYVESLLMKE